MKVAWRARAVEDRREIFSYIATRNHAAAVQLNEALILAGDSLATFPNRGRAGSVPGTRELVAILPYVLIYQVDLAADTVRILRVWHGARDR